MKTHIIRSAFLLLTAFAIIGGCHSKNGGQIIVITPNGASDIPGGAENATLREAAIFAWQDFIAFNWPALSKTRDVPDSEAIFGVTNPAVPVVWQTFRHKVEIFPGTGNPPGFNANSPDFGYSSVPPKYVYGEGEVGPCTDRAPIAEPALSSRMQDTSCRESVFTPIFDDT